MSQELNILLLVFGAVAAFVYAMFTLVDPYWVRVKSRVGEMDDAIRDAPVSAPRENHSARWVDYLQQRNYLPSASRPILQQRLARAGVYDPAAVSRYFAARMLLMVIPALAAIPIGATGMMRLDWTLLMAAFCAGGGFLAPTMWLSHAIHRRHRDLHRSLPDFLDLMTVCLEGGLSIQASIRQVGDELRIVHPTLAGELAMVQREMDLGATVDQALKRFGDRSGNSDVRTLSAFIREAQRFGTKITDALRGHSELLRSQREQAAEENAQKASVKILLPTLLLIFPAVFVVVVGPAVIQIYEAFCTK